MSWGGSKDNDSKVFPVKDRQKQRFLGWGEALGTRLGGGGEWGEGSGSTLPVICQTLEITVITTPPLVNREKSKCFKC